MSDIPHKAHDKFIRSGLRYKRACRSFVQLVLPKKYSKALDMRTVRHENTHYLSKKFHETFSDTALSVRIRGMDKRLWILLEHLSNAQPMAPFRLDHYMFEMLYEPYRKDKRRPVPEVYSLVLYHGKSTPFPESLDLVDCFDNSLGVASDRYKNISPIPIVDLNEMTDAQLKPYDYAGVLCRALKHIRDDDISECLLDIVDDLGGYNVSDSSHQDFVDLVLYYLLGTGNVKDIDRTLAMVEQLQSPLGENVMTAAEQLMAKGHKKGREEGHKDVAINLLKAGSDLKFVAQMSKLKLAEVKQIKLALDAKNDE